MKRRLIPLLLICTLLIGFLPSCTGERVSEDDLGKINDIEMENTQDSNPPLFEEQKCPFTGYSMKTVKYYSALMSFKIPTSWGVAAINPSQIKITVPADDANFPGNTFYVQSVFDYQASGNDLDPESSDINRMYRPFECYLEGLTYSIGGSAEGTLRRWRGGWDETRTPSFVDDKQLAMTAFLGDENLYNAKTSTSAAQNVGLVATFFKWQDFPVMISTFTDDSKMEDAAKMTEYIMSTALYKAPKISNTEDKEFSENFTATLPVEFSPIGENENAYAAPVTDTLSSSGISIGIYKVSDKYADEATNASYILNSEGEAVILDLMDQRCAGQYTPTFAVTGEATRSISGENRAFFANCNLISTGDNRASASLSYGPASLQYMDFYIIKKKGGTYMVVSLFSRQQAKLAYNIERLVVKSLNAQ